MSNPAEIIVDEPPFFFFFVSRLLKASAPAGGDEASVGQARLEAIEEEETVRMHITALKREEVALLVSPSVVFALLCFALRCLAFICRVPSYHGTVVASARVHGDKRQLMLESRRFLLFAINRPSEHSNSMQWSNAISRLTYPTPPDGSRHHDALLLLLGQEEKRALNTRKVLHIRELKRVTHEDRSKFSKRPTLSGRCEPFLQLVS